MGPLEIGIILVIVLIIFGVGKLPQVGESLGKGIRAFRKGQSEDDEAEKEKNESVAAVQAETPPATEAASTAPAVETKTEAPKAEAPKAEAPKTEAKETPPAMTDDDED